MKNPQKLGSSRSPSRNDGVGVSRKQWKSKGNQRVQIKCELCLLYKLNILFYGLSLAAQCNPFDRAYSILHYISVNERIMWSRSKFGHFENENEKQ